MLSAPQSVGLAAAAALASAAGYDGIYGVGGRGGGVAEERSVAVALFGYLCELVARGPGRLSGRLVASCWGGQCLWGCHDEQGE